MSTVSSNSFGMFSSHPVDVFLLILDKFDYAAMASLCQTNSPMKTLIRKEMRRRAFLNTWIQKASDMTQLPVDCFHGLGLLIAAAFGGTPEALDTLKTFLDAGFEATKRFDGPGILLGSFLSSNRELSPQLITNAFLLGWSLGDGYFDGEARKLVRRLRGLDHYEQHEHLIAAEHLEAERKRYDCWQQKVFMLRHNIHMMCYSPWSSPFIQRQLFVEMYRRVASQRVLMGNATEVATLLNVVLTRSLPGTTALNRAYFAELRTDTALGHFEIGRLADTFALLHNAFITSMSSGDVALLSAVYHRFTRTVVRLPAEVSGALIAIQPFLLTLHLHNPADYMCEDSATHVLTGLVTMYHMKRADVHFEHFMSAIRQIRGAQHEDVLAHFCHMIVSTSVVHDRRLEAIGDDYDCRKNRFYINFFKLLEDE